jgi:2-keto-4-pentenoate hydratase/2-oxohepta-3-ene-1,7-dioic acid hydratase in catechol pathway
MKIVRYSSATGEIGYAQLHGDGSHTRLRGDLFGGLEATSEAVQPGRVLAPVEPRAVLCTGLNYRKHAIETGSPIPTYPVLFMKSPGALQDPGEPIVLPRWMTSHKVDFECELAVVIGKRCKNVSRANALDYVLGYTCANDVSARDWQKEGGGSQWCRGKTFDTFLPLGPCLVTADEIGSGSGLRISTMVGDEVLQDSNTSDMIFDIPTLIEFYSGSTTLLPGTVILTGTPSGVGLARTPQRFLKAGETVTVEIEKIGKLRNPVVEEVATGGSEFRL